LGLGFNPKQDGDGTPAQQQQFAENLRMLIARRAKAPLGTLLSVRILTLDDAIANCMFNGIYNGISWGYNGKVIGYK
jgi:hypothetical protein